MKLTDVDREQQIVELITHIMAMTEYLTRDQRDETALAAHAALANVSQVAVTLSPAARDSPGE